MVGKSIKKRKSNRVLPLSTYTTHGIRLKAVNFFKEFLHKFLSREKYFNFEVFLDLETF